MFFSSVQQHFLLGFRGEFSRSCSLAEITLSAERCGSHLQESQVFFSGTRRSGLGGSEGKQGGLLRRGVLGRSGDRRGPRRKDVGSGTGRMIKCTFWLGSAYLLPRTELQFRSLPGEQSRRAAGARVPCHCSRVLLNFSSPRSPGESRKQPGGVLWSLGVWYVVLMKRNTGRHPFTWAGSRWNSWFLVLGSRRAEHASASQVSLKTVAWEIARCPDGLPRVCM